MRDTTPGIKTPTKAQNWQFLKWKLFVFIQNIAFASVRLNSVICLKIFRRLESAKSQNKRKSLFPRNLEVGHFSRKLSTLFFGSSPPSNVSLPSCGTKLREAGETGGVPTNVSGSVRLKYMHADGIQIRKYGIHIHSSTTTTTLFEPKS